MVFNRGVLASDREDNEPKTKPTKTKRGVREIPIPSFFVEWLKVLLQRSKSQYVIPGHHGGQMGQTEFKNLRNRANTKLKSWFNKAGAIQNKAAAGEKLNKKEAELLGWIKDNCGDQHIENHSFVLHFKILRHTYCTELFDLGIDEVSAARIMGHHYGLFILPCIAICYCIYFYLTFKQGVAGSIPAWLTKEKGSTARVFGPAPFCYFGESTEIITQLSLQRNTSGTLWSTFFPSGLYLNRLQPYRYTSNIDSYNIYGI